MSLTTSSIRYPVSVIVGVLIAVMGGLIALTRIPVQLTPEVDRLIITVSTSWPGASPEEVEKEIVEQQEEFLKSVEGVLEMTSQASAGFSVVTLEFPVGTDLTGAVVRVTNRLNEVPSYPDNAKRPVVSSSSRLEGAIAWYVIRSDSGVYVPHMQWLIEDLVKPRLERVLGVSSINIFGGLAEELHVTFDPDLLASWGITIDQMSTSLRQQNIDVSAGDFAEGKRRYVVRTLSRFESVSDVEEAVIATRDGVSVRVSDVAKVTLAYQKPRALVRSFGQPSIAFNAQRQVGANVLDVIDGLDAQVEAINLEVMEPRGLRIYSVYKQSIYIESAINLVLSNLYLGGLLAIGILFFFLRSRSAVFVVALAIPISVITTFLFMYAFGRTLNVISLAGMAFAVGMVVDSSIVVLENIYRHLQMGKDRWKAAADATREVWGALLASTVTTVAVFLPIMFVVERAGQLFKDIAIAICSAIVISLIVSITVIPSLSARVLSVSGRKEDSESGLLPRIAAKIAAIVDYVNASTRRRLVTIVSVVAVSMGLTVWLMPASEYLPTGNQNLIFGIILPPPGYNMAEMVKAGEQIESQMSYLWDADAESKDTLPGGGIENFFYVALGNMAIMGMRANDATRVKELLPIANAAIFSIPGTFGFASQTSIFGRGFAGSRSVRINVTGPDLPQILQVAGRVFAQVGEILPGSRSRPIPGLDLGNPEVRVIPDRVRAADVGITAAEIGRAVNALVDGYKVSEYFHQGREIDVILKGQDERARHTQDIAQLPLAVGSGRIITVGDVAQIVQRQGPVQINHVERQRVIAIETVLPEDIPLEVAMARLQTDLIEPLRAEGAVGGLFDIGLSGTADDLTKLTSELATDFIVAVVLIYLLMAALFQSFIYPLVVLLTVPLATFGGVLGLNLIRLFDNSQQLDILTMLGFVILVGTVINNSILIVYQAIHLMKEGYDPRQAVKESVRIRVRPIFMSTGTSAFGMLPLILMPGAGSELYRGLGAVVVGGLVLSTVITLLLTPLVFSFAIETLEKLRGLVKWRPAEIVAAQDMSEET